MEALHSPRKLQPVSTCTYTSFHWKWTKSEVGELLGRSGGLNITSIQVDSISGVKNRCRSSLLVVVPSHLILCLYQCCLGFFQGYLHPLSELIDCFQPRRSLVWFKTHPRMSPCV